MNLDNIDKRNLKIWSLTMIASFLTMLINPKRIILLLIIQIVSTILIIPTLFLAEKVKT